MKDILLKVIWPVIPYGVKKKLWPESQADFDFINDTTKSVDISELPEYQPGQKWTFQDSINFFNYSLSEPNTDLIELLNVTMRQIEIHKIDFFDLVDRSYGMILLNHVYIQAYLTTNDLRYLNLALKIRDMIIYHIAPVSANKYSNIYNTNCFLMNKAIKSLQDI